MRGYLDTSMNEKSPADSIDPLSKKKNDSDSIVRGLLSSSIQYSHEKQPPGLSKDFLVICLYRLFLFLSGDSSSTLTQLLNENSGQHDLIRTSVPPQAKVFIRTTGSFYDDNFFDLYRLIKFH